VQEALESFFIDSRPSLVISRPAQPKVWLENMDSIKDSTQAGEPLRGLLSEESFEPLLFKVAGAQYTASPLGQVSHSCIPRLH
jgi:hypothetical protein